MSLIIEAAETASVRTQSAISVKEFYEFTIAEPRPNEVEIDGKPYRPHPNGGGLVAISAYVGADVYVAPSAQVRDSAIVINGARILDRAVVQGNAAVKGRCKLSGDSIAEGFATLTGMVTLRHCARVGGTARLQGGILIDCHTRITRGQLFGPLFIG